MPDYREETLKMARAYAARLGCIAFVFGLARNILNGGRIELALVSCVGLLLVFSVLGWIIGAFVEELIRQSVEANFRNSIEKHRQRVESMAAKQN